MWGNCMRHPLLDKLQAAWVHWFNKSATRKEEARRALGFAPLTSWNSLKWYSSYALREFIASKWVELRDFFRTQAQAQEVVACFEAPGETGFETCVAVEIGRPLAFACYALEGDGPVMLVAHDIVAVVEHHLRAHLCHSHPASASTQALGSGLARNAGE